MKINIDNKQIIIEKFYQLKKAIKEFPEYKAAFILPFLENKAALKPLMENFNDFMELVQGYLELKNVFVLLVLEDPEVFKRVAGQAWSLKGLTKEFPEHKTAIINSFLDNREAIKQLLEDHDQFMELEKYLVNSIKDDIARMLAAGCKPGDNKITKLLLEAARIIEGDFDSLRQIFAINLPDDNSLLPDEFTCPITHNIMVDPVKLVDGRTNEADCMYHYERAAIQRWLDDRNTSPMTRAIISEPKLTSDNKLKDKIYTYKLSLVGQQLLKNVTPASQAGTGSMPEEEKLIDAQAQKIEASPQRLSSRVSIFSSPVLRRDCFIERPMFRLNSVIQDDKSPPQADFQISLGL